MWWREKQAVMFPQLTPHKHLGRRHQSGVTLSWDWWCGIQPGRMGLLFSQWKRAEESVSLGDGHPGVLPIHKYDWEFEEFAKGYVIPTQCQEEDGPDITQAEAAGAQKPCTVGRWTRIHQPPLNLSETLH